MNIMRKLWVGGTGSSSGSFGSGGNNGGNGPFSGNSGGNSPQSISLGLMHLRKLFGDYLHSPSDDKIYNMLPLFCKVFSSSSASDMVERFPEINSFCQAVSKLMVAEVRKRASNQSTEAAAISIIRFFEAASANEEDSRGWTLLSTLNLLAAGEENLILILTGASVPSTLVKCLYLFFDLPEIQPPERKGPASDFSPMERRLLLQKIFVQLLIRLSSHPSPTEELAKRDDLALLFSAVTSWCPPQNAMWRKSTSEVLMTISTQIIHSPPVLSYIHNKGCIALCVDNLRRGTHLTPLEITEMVLTLFCFLKDSSDLSQVLLDDFKSAQGYQFFVEVLLRLESDLSSESQEAIRNLTLVVSSLTMCGFVVLKPNMANVESLFSLPTFQLPPSGAKGCTVRNLQAFQVLQSIFTKSTTAFLSGVILDAISSVFKAENSNYFIVDSVLPQMAEKLITKTCEVHQKFLEIVEFIVFQLQFTPCKELIAISRILKNDLSETTVTVSGNQSDSTTTTSRPGSNRNSVVLNSITQADIDNETRLKLFSVKMLLNLAKHNSLFKDVYREIGILEALVICLHRFGSDKQDVNYRNVPDLAVKEELGLVVIELLTLILTATTANVNIFRENSGSKCALQLATSSSTRGPALGLIQQLLMSQGGEEDMSSVLVALHSSSVNTSLGLKIDILTGLLTCFRESHRARCNFRKAGGFLYLMSVLVSMEGLLLQQNISISVIRERMHMVQLIFTAFALSMRFEPANAKLFHQEICLPSLSDTLRLLGCFSREFRELPSKFPGSGCSSGESSSLVTEENVQLFHSIFTTSPSNLDPQSYQGKVPFPLVLSVFLFRLLYDLAIDSFERNFPPSVNAITPSFRSSPRKQISGDTEGTSNSSGVPSGSSSPIPPGTPIGKKLSVGSLNLTPPTPEPVLIHSAVVIVMVKLIPSIWQNVEENSGPEMNYDKSTMSIIAACQLYCSELVKSLVRNEKNQQLMAQAGLVEEILERCAVALSDESHYLHSPIHYVFERVATHSLSPRDFRRFFRLGNPLNCDRLSPQSANISTISSLPVSRIKSLVSMTMSKSGSHQGISQTQTSSHQANSSAPVPPFVEFDMSAEGFGALFLPSLAPHNVPIGSEFGSTGLLATGIGMGERVFPGVTGMSFSTWFSVDKFSDPRIDPHPIRILTIIKENGTNQKLCLCIVVSARDKAMIVSTRESPLPAQGIGEWEPEGTLSGSVRVWCPELLHEGQWHHLFFAFSTSSSHSFTVYVNGRLASTGKLEYPHRTKGASYSAFIGTPPVWRKASRLTWRQGVTHFFEDWVPGAQTVHSIYKLGPEYPGSWQAVKIQSETAGTLIAEDKIIFGLNAMAVSQLTLAKIRKIYSKTDAKAIAKQLGLSSHENATPISILHNSAAHLIGPARTLGGVTIGYIGVRVFTPLPVSKSILSIGGIQVLIGLVAMANTGEMLYASLKAFVCVVKSNLCGSSSTTLVSETAWQMLGYLLKRKKYLLTMRVLHLVFDLSGGTANLNRESRSGFVELLGDIDIWCPLAISSNNNAKSAPGIFDSGASTPDSSLRKVTSSEEPTPTPSASLGLQNSQKFDFLQANIDLEKALYEHFLQLLNDDHKNSLDVLRDANIVPKLLRRLTLSPSPINQGPIFLLLSHLLAHKGNASAVDLITFGHFIAGTLPSLNKRETSISDGIELRNKGLQLIHSLMYTGKVLNVGFCDELVHRLGYDFVLLFVTSNLHSSTLLWSIRILLLLITSSPTLKNKFRDGSQSAWCFGKTAIAAQQCGGSLRNSYALLPLKRQETRDGEESSGSGTPVSGGPVSVIAGGLTGKSGKGLTGGWARLSWLLAQRCEDLRSEGTDVFPSEIWLILCAMVLSQPCRNVSLKLGDSDQLTLDAIWNYVFAVPSNRMATSLYGKVSLCPDAIITLLTLIRCFITAEAGILADRNLSGVGNGVSFGNPNLSLLPRAQTHSPLSSPLSQHSDIASCLVQFLCYLYTHTPEFQTVFTSTEILSALSATVMPIDVKAGIGNLIIDNITEVGDCEEIKAFPDTEPLVVLGKSINELDSFESKHDWNENPSDSSGENSDSPEIYKRKTPVPAPVVLGPTSPMENLMNHSAKKIILDFLRMLIIDWMSSSASQSQSKTGIGMNVVIDTVLEAGNTESEIILGSNGLFPSSGQYSPALLIQFHTNLLGTLLDHLIAFDMDRMTGYLQAVAHFLSRLVDKLWLESFARDPQVVFDFILILVSHCKTKRVPPTTTDMIYNSLNRVVLFILSRKSNQWDKVEALKKIRGVRSVIFGSGNHQQDFFGCLVYVLMQLVDGLPITLESGNRTQWHVRVAPISSDEDSVDATINRTRPRNTRATATLDNEISKTADKVWEDLFISKKPMVEDVFKITFSSPQPPSLSSLRDDIGDTANKLWLTYVASETSPGSKKSNNPAGLSQSWEIHQQLQSKLQKVTGGLTRLAGRSGIRKESEKEKTIKDVVSQWNEAKKCQIGSNKQLMIIKDVLEVHERCHLENTRHLHRYVRDTLLPQLELELTRERGLWGPTQPSYLDKWMLDTTEGPCRMRKKLMRNEMFYMHYPYLEQQMIPSSGGTGSVVCSPKARRINPPISRDSKEFHKKFKHQPSFINEISGGLSLDDMEDSAGGGASGSTSSDSNLSPKTTGTSSIDDPFSEGSVDSASDPDNQSMLFRLIGTANEKISQIFRVAQIQGLDTAEGLLLFGKDHFYLISGFTILAKTREIKDMYYLPANMYEPILPPQCYGSGPSPAKPRSKTHSCWKFCYEDMREVHKRRYLLQPIALEIFCSDGINYLLAFPRKVRNVVFQKFTSVSKNLSDSGTDAKQSVAGQRRTTSVEQSAGIFSSLIGDTSVTQRWVRGETSNFQYLMYMNTLAGRSYNDLMQYPVFPWILADYDSPYLDFNDPETFRDLSRPMGAQSNTRLVQFVKRFKEWDDPHGETPPYHYGTHYSSAMIVCSYLVRMEPFAQHFLRLQGGHFDLADRMFHSIKEAWTSASTHNMADVKELIPEFFYLPEFLQNNNNFDLGLKQNGVALGDVLLPPWAKNDPNEFIRVHREALESDYVSQHLHEWIDLVFGYKQQGQPAVDAVNVFHHLFYEGNVDIYTIDDPLKKNATIGFINNFGQIPKQLFKKPHPIKRVNSSGGNLCSGLGIIKQYNILEGQNPLMALAATAGSAVSSQSISSSGEKLIYHHVDHLRPTLAPIKELKGPVGQIMSLDRPNVIIAVEQNKFLMSSSKYISWGFADGSVRVSNVDTDRPHFIWEQCQQQLWMGSLGEIVTCTAASEKITITGSTNTVVSVWEFVDKELRLKSHLYGHSEAITCLTCSPSYNIIVSGSKDLTCIVWDLARLSFVRQLVSHSSPIDAVGVNELTGDIATCDGSWLRLWSMNGDLIGQIDTAGVGGGGGMSQGILCVSFSYLNEWDGDNVVITGSTDGIVRMWSVRFVQVPEEDVGGNQETEGLLVVNQSLTDDSSVITGSDSDEPVETDLNDMNQSEDESTRDNTELLSAEVFDPDKDRDSLEDIREGAGIETQVDKIKNSVRRQRALSSGTSSGGTENTKLRSDSSLTTADKRAKRKSDIPKQGSSSNVGEGTESSSVKESNRPSIRSSKSENSLSFEESFDILSETEVAALRKEERERKMSYGSALLAANVLKEGHVWQKRIIFRGKLTMHTAYDRQDNKEPASITAITISRDHKNVYVGDARGRVFSWTCSDSVAGRVDHWMRDDVSDTCGTCKTKFSMTERRHHCRSCGAVFCSKCSRFESEIFRLRILRPVRVCQPCFVQLKGDVSRSAKISTSSDI